MIECGEVRPEGGIYEPSSDILKLSEIHLKSFSKYVTIHFWTLRLLRRNTFKAKMYIEANRKWFL